MKYLFLLFLLPSISLAATTIEIEPAKVELKMASGESTTTAVSIINRSDSAVAVTTEFQDFVAGDSPEVPAKLLGTATSTYGLQQFMSLPAVSRQFLLQPNERRVVPLQISLPAGTPAGGLYAGLVFAIDSPEQRDIHFTNGIASLFFVTVTGPTRAVGELKDFSVQRTGSQITGYNYLFENSGEIYLNPYGYVSLRDWRDREIYFTELRPAFVMPGSARLQKLPQNISLQSGWYQAKIALNRGYDNQIDQKTVNIFIWPKWLGLVSALAAVLVWLLIWWRRSNRRQ